MKTAIFYGSSTGNTKGVAEIIASKLNADIYDVADNPTDHISSYECLILGTSTWGSGDLQDDWETFIQSLAKTDLNNKTVALFGLGDSSSFPDTFVNGMGEIYQIIKDKGCRITGMVDSSEYDFEESLANIGDKFVGLALDEDNEGSLTSERIDKWIKDLAIS